MPQAAITNSLREISNDFCCRVALHPVWPLGAKVVVGRERERERENRCVALFCRRPISGVFGDLLGPKVSSSSLRLLIRRPTATKGCLGKLQTGCQTNQPTDRLEWLERLAEPEFRTLFGLEAEKRRQCIWQRRRAFEGQSPAWESSWRARTARKCAKTKMTKAKADYAIKTLELRPMSSYSAHLLCGAGQFVVVSGAYEPR